MLSSSACTAWTRPAHLPAFRRLSRKPLKVLWFITKNCVWAAATVLSPAPSKFLRMSGINPSPGYKSARCAWPRVADNQMPACASVCPTSAITFGKREDLLKEAKSRIAANPALYVDHIYGGKRSRRYFLALSF